MIQLNARNYAWNKRKHDTAQHSCVRHLGNALDKRDWRWHLTSAFSQRLRKHTFTAVHTKTHKRSFQIYLLWRAFSNLCVYGERFHRLRVDGRPKRIKKFAFTSVCVYNRLRVDGALDGGRDRSATRLEVIFHRKGFLPMLYPSNLTRHEAYKTRVKGI